MPNRPRALPTLIAGLLVLAASGLPGCANRADEGGSNAPPVGDDSSPVTVAATPKVDVVELSVAEAQAGMAADRFSSADLVDAYLARIAAVDDSGPTLNAVIALNPAARADAEALDAERAAGQLRGPLHGIPVLVKDNIDVAGLPTTAGSLALANHVPADDAALVASLRKAGAVILGKTNLSEWANFRSTSSISGWSSAGGQTRNPYVLDRNACGSSSGTGAAIAASLATVGVGTETDGSILCPSAVNGLAGFKPTVGVIPADGIVPISASQDTAGPMARSVADASALMEAMSGLEPIISTEAPETTDDTAAASPLSGKRFGLLRQAMGRHAGLDAATEAAVARLRAAGAEVVDAEIPTWGQWGEAELTVLLYEFKDGLNRYLAEGPAPVANLEALIAWNTANADRAMPWFAQELFEQAQAKGPLTDPAYLEARTTAKRLAGENGLLKVLREGGFDALIAPTTGPAWPIDPVLGDHFTSAGYGAAAVAGTPSLTLPMGEIHGLPVGLSLLGPQNGDAGLLALGAAVEATLAGARRAPEFRPTLQP
ncbi:amidase [Silanimonas sp.]|jgi:amidase|uniref:amidase n=1 Tax=Silanimonas sp. TaxID=1929290 RepID=UPI0022CB58D8|nr:amidase [Silanimonas sp.]MCZ8114768.1 amidase [Silanimonas sp.]